MESSHADTLELKWDGCYKYLVCPPWHKEHRVYAGSRTLQRTLYSRAQSSPGHYSSIFVLVDPISGWCTGIIGPAICKLWHAIFGKMCLGQFWQSFIWMLTECMCVLVEGRDLRVELNHQVWKKSFSISVNMRSTIIDPDISHRHSDVFICYQAICECFLLWNRLYTVQQTYTCILTASQNIQPKGCMVHMYK